VWGVTRFVGSFLDTLGREAAETLVGWLRELSAGAKDGARDRIVTLRFELPDGAIVFGFIPITADDDFASQVRPAIEAVGSVAAVAVRRRSVGFSGTHDKQPSSGTKVSGISHGRRTPMRQCAS
jgi:hypothetical protein